MSNSFKVGIRRGSIAGSGPMVLVHGGAWDIPFYETEAHEEGMRLALERGRRLLLQNKNATWVVREVVSVLEQHQAFDSGYGAVLNQDGEAELDAGIMCGKTMAFGAVAGTKTIEHPICVAHNLMENGGGQSQFLVGEGAERYAVAMGFHPVKSGFFTTEREYRRFEELRQRRQFHTSLAFSGEENPRGTVGCVVLDTDGNLAAGTSTGGVPFTLAGRVGDSPVPGAGYFADRLVACSATGWGEGILAIQLCTRTALRVANGLSPSDAATEQLGLMRHTFIREQKIDATAGLIVLDHQGNGGWAYTTPRMARGGWHLKSPIWTAI